MQKFKMAAKKWWGKRVLAKSVRTFLGQKFCRNHSHCFRDNCVLANYTDFQDAREKMAGKLFFGKKVAYDSAYTLRVRNFIEITISHRSRDKCILSIISRWPPNTGNQLLAKSAICLGVCPIYQNCSVSNHLQNFKMAAKKAGKQLLAQSAR